MYLILCICAQIVVLFVNNVYCGLYAGEKLSAVDMNPALEMFYELMNDTSQFKNQEETQWASIGHYIRSEVHILSKAQDLNDQVC